MRTGWKILGGTGVASIVAIAILVGQSSLVQGDTSSDTTTTTTSTTSASGAALGGYHQPDEPYSLGPHTIAYEQLSAANKSGVDSIMETVETSQPASSYAEIAKGVSDRRQRAQAEFAARRVGLVGTGDEGVVP